MTTYQDQYSMYHDRPTDGINHSSNNRAIYTAYGEKLLPGTIKSYKTHRCYNECRSYSNGVLRVNRNPGSPTPPLSRDEVIGWISLEEMYTSELKDQYYTFCNLKNFVPKPLHKINWFKAIGQLWKLRNKHRNAIWQESGYDEAMQLAFRLSPGDVYYIKSLRGYKTTLLERFWWHLGALQTVLNKKEDTQSLSSKNILWLQLKDLRKENSWFFKKLDQKRNFMLYFGADHPFNNIED